MSYVYLGARGVDRARRGDQGALAQARTDQSSVERLRREAGLAMRLDHPNVCRILRLGESRTG